MNREEREKYYASREWALLKRAVRERSGGNCERCRIGNYESTHHLTYARIGNEMLADLLGVCDACHRYLSGNSNFDPLITAGAAVTQFLANRANELQGHIEEFLGFLESFKLTEPSEKVRMSACHSITEFSGQLARFRSDIEDAATELDLQDR